MLDDTTVARIASLFRQHPDSKIVFTDSIAADSYVVDRSTPTPTVYLHPTHKDLVALQASWHTTTVPGQGITAANQPQPQAGG